MQSQKKADHFQSENKDLIEKLTAARTAQIKTERDLQQKDEQLEEEQGEFEKTIRAKQKVVSQLTFDLQDAQEKVKSLTKQLTQIESSHNKDLKGVEEGLKRNKE
jgi:predicted RNase H-like nuclease (RuvC/YqgF family)